MLPGKPRRGQGSGTRQGRSWAGVQCAASNNIPRREGSQLALFPWELWGPCPIRGGDLVTYPFPQVTVYQPASKSPTSNTVINHLVLCENFPGTYVPRSGIAGCWRQWILHFAKCCLQAVLRGDCGFPLPAVQGSHLPTFLT